MLGIVRLLEVDIGAIILLLTAVAQMAPQYPSPMSDTTRPHPRIERYEVPGRRAALPTGTLFLSPDFEPRERHPLLVHFHGAPWLLEHHVRRHAPQTVLVTLQLGSGSRAYADAFADAGRFGALVTESAARASELVGRRVDFGSITLSSFSAGYGAIRSILRNSVDYARVDAVLLADSLHASYVGDAAAPRAADLPVDETGLDVFAAFAADAAAGRKRMRVTHSEVYPGTYASTTETANVLLKRLKLARRRVLRDGPIGMQQLSEASVGGFLLRGFAGNSAPDHMDHLYAIGELLADRRQNRGVRRQVACLLPPVPCLLSYTDNSRWKNER